LPGPIDSTVYKTARYVLIGALLLAGAWMLQRFLPALSWAVVLAVATASLYDHWLKRFFGRRRHLWAALTFTAIVGAIVVVPLIYFGFVAVRETTSLVRAFAESSHDGPPALPEWLRQLPTVGDWIQSQWVQLIGQSDGHVASAAVRAHGGRNIFLRMTVDADSRASWSNWFAHLHSRESGTALTQAFTRNAHYWQLWPQLDIADSDTKVEKVRFGAFVPGASALHEILQSHRIDTLIISGTLSNCCCESTARDAMQMNYKIIFVSDANAALSDAAHNATLENMAFLFGDVPSTDELLRSIEESSTAGAPRIAAG